VPVPTGLVLEIPRIVVEFDDALPGHAASGFSDWDQHRHLWVITINPQEPATRQRFTMLHIIDHDRLTLSRPAPRSVYGLPPVEYLADYFAGCVLMPKRLFRAAYYDGIQRARDLAELFDVSTRAAEVRLSQLGLQTDPILPPSTRSYRLQPSTRPGRYQRLSSWTQTASPANEVRA
jgi:Zn-dependent peptidase ImmA (M78 family)